MMINNKEISSFINNNIKVNQNPVLNTQEKSEVKSFQEVLLETVKLNKTIASDLKVRQYALNKPELIISKHARQRAEQRNIDIDEALESINGAVIKAAGKNLKNVLVLREEAAFIVSVDNNVVVTAMSGEDMRENVITNIDGTVII
jgi:flagellar operon protein